MSLRSRREVGRRRSAAAAAAVVAGTLLVWLVITAIPASAAVTCTDTPDIDPGAPVVHQVAVSVGTDSTVGLRFVAGALQVADNPPAALTVAAGTVWAACGGAAPINVVKITGQDNGGETVRLVNGGDGADLNGWGGPETFIDLGNGNDKVEFTSLMGAYLGVEFGTSVGGSTIADANWAVESVGTDTADVQILHTESLMATGDTTATGVTDSLLAAGDSNPRTIDITPAGAGPEDLTVPGTADGAGDITGVDPRGNLTAPVTLNGGVGNDFLEPGNGNDTIIGGAGDDTVIYAEAPSAVTVDLTAGTEAGGSGNDTLSDIQSIAGSLFNDTLTGSAIDNRISGCGGSDIIDGGAGNDTLRGDATDPGLPPGLSVCPPSMAGNDTFVEGTSANGSDTIEGDGNTGAGDTLDYSGRTGALYVAPGGGLVSGEGGCPLGAGCEKDNINADIENFILGSGNDTFVGSGNAELIQGGPGDDKIDGGGGFDYLDLSDAAGPAVFDTVAGTATGDGNDTFANVEGFIGTAGDDTLIGNQTTLQTGGPICGGPVTFDFVGGQGTDTVDGSSGTGGECVDLGVFGNGHEVENAFGGSGDDTLAGNALGNTLMGNDGFDTVDGFGGNDFIDGGLGNDLLDTALGNTGADTLTFRDVTAGMGGEDVDNQLGFATGPDGQDTLGFFAIIHGTPNDDSIRAGQNAFSANNRLYGAGGDDDLIGSSSSDILNGGAGDDTMRAGGGDDTLWGKKGNDLLVGGKGFDVGKGGKGKDTCKGVEVAKSC